MILILLLALGLRLAGITFDSLWLDEAYQSMADAFGQSLPNLLQMHHQPFLFHFEQLGNLSAALTVFRQVDPLCPPLYAVLLNLWMHLAGAGDLSVRFLSVIFSMLSIVFMFLFCRNFLGQRAALLAALVQAVSPFDIYYAQEARMYSLVALSSCLSMGSLFALLHTKRERAGLFGCALLYTASTWCLINSHYTALFTVLFGGLYATTLCIRDRRWRTIFSLLVCWLGVFLLWLPWLDIFRHAASIRGQSFYVAHKTSLWWPIWAIAVRMPFNWLIFLSGKKVVAYAIPLYATAAGMLILSAQALFANPPVSRSKCFLGKKQVHRSDQESPNRQPDDAAGISTMVTHPRPVTLLTSIWLWAVVPPLLIWLSDVIEGHRVVEIARYVISTSPAVYMLAGFGLANSRGIGDATAVSSFIPSQNSDTTGDSLSAGDRSPGIAGIPLASEAGYRASRLNSTAWLSLLLMIHAAFALTNNLWSHLAHQKEPWQNLANLIESHASKNDLIMVSQYYDIVCLDRYLRTPFRQIGVSPNLGASMIAQDLSEYSRFWLVTAQEGESVKDVIPRCFHRVQEYNLEHGLHLRLYRRESSSTDPKINPRIG